MLALPLCGRQQPTPVSIESSQNPPPALLVPLAAQIKDNADKIGCKPGKCKILVTDFAFPGKGSPRFAIQLSDALSLQLSSGINSYPVADRAQLQNLLREEFITPEAEQFDDIARWLGRKLNANAVLTGEMSATDDKSLELSARFLSTGDFKHKGLSLKGKFNIDLSKVDLTQSNNIPPVPSSGGTLEGLPLYPAMPGRMPQCSYLPNPPYTEEARENHISGVILFEAIVGVDGKLRDLRIIRGLPGGLNRKTLETAATWRCQPPIWEGKPVPVVVPFEVNFKLFY